MFRHRRTRYCRVRTQYCVQYDRRNLSLQHRVRHGDGSPCLISHPRRHSSHCWQGRNQAAVGFCGRSSATRGPSMPAHRQSGFPPKPLRSLLCRRSSTPVACCATAWSIADQYLPNITCYCVIGCNRAAKIQKNI